jgi:hypothetical protein
MENRKCGALWIKEGKGGEFMSGELIINGNKVSIVAFKRKKLNDKEPDWDILKSKEPEGLVV